MFRKQVLKVIWEKARRSSADKKNSKLLVSHISRNLGHGLPNCIDWVIIRLRPCAVRTAPVRSPCAAASLKHGGLQLAPLVVRFVVLLAYVFADEFLFNPQFDLEPDYMIRKPVVHRIPRWGFKIVEFEFEFEFELARTFCHWQVPKPSSCLMRC